MSLFLNEASFARQLCSGFRMAFANFSFGRRVPAGCVQLFETIKVGRSCRSILHIQLVGQCIDLTPIP